MSSPDRERALAPDQPLDPAQTARAAGLRYASDEQPGYTRVRNGAGFSYRDPAGLREVSGQPLSAKDLRTWGGTVLAAALWELGAGESRTERERNVKAAIKAVAHVLGNTPAVSRKDYVHSALLEAYLEGELLPTLEPYLAGRRRPPEGLEDSEAAVLAFLRGRADEAAVA